MQNFLNINGKASTGSQPLAVGKEPVGDILYGKMVLRVLWKN